MPCRYFTPEEEAYHDRLAVQQRLEDASEVIHGLRGKEVLLDELTKNVCAMFKRLEKDFTEESFKDVTTPAMRKWWKEHQEMDAARKEKEANPGIRVTKRPARPSRV